jgi:adenylyltransferase/sulfurtransferase
VVDGDVVEPANLQRQILHREADLGRRKAASAQETLTALNPHCQVKTFDQRLEAANIGLVLKGYDLVLDASDNFPTRFLVADCCWLEKIPLISAAASGFQGLLLVVEPAAGNPCYRCLMPALPPAGGGPEGILGAVAGVMGSLQAVEALKFLLGRGSGLSRRLLSYDGLKGRFHTMDRVRNPDCSGCKYYDC